MPGPAAAGYVMSAGQSKQLTPLLSQRPMDVYVATGPADACGPGCSEWIAVEGRFDAGAGKRFREFLNSSRRRSLPVFFHSPGGALSAGIEIAVALRENRMTAGVGRTTQQGCTVLRVSGGNCDLQVKSGNDVASQFTFESAQCHSACVYALAGAVTRKIAPSALVGIHAAKTDERAWKQFADQNPGVRRLTPDERNQGVWRFLMGLGLDPALVDLASKISHNSIYVLGRDELVRYGLESSDRFETRWLLRGTTGQPNQIIKALTDSDPTTGQPVTAIAQIACSDLFGYRLTLLRPLPKDQFGQPPPAHLEAGGTRITLMPGVTQSVAYWTTVARPDEIQKLAAEREIDIALVYARGPETAVAIKMSTAGLSAVLNELQKSCSQRKVNSSAVQPSSE
ncbi:MAG TPA: hypothetical protein VM867_02925 [Xanthobacteraceae bacterium]|nr:hypothetical protein [Xanthobacteraceae bacterium]